MTIFQIVELEQVNGSRRGRWYSGTRCRIILMA